MWNTLISGGKKTNKWAKNLKMFIHNIPQGILTSQIICNCVANKGRIKILALIPSKHTYYKSQCPTISFPNLSKLYKYYEGHRCDPMRHRTKILSTLYERKLNYSVVKSSRQEKKKKEIIANPRLSHNSQGV